MSVYVAVCQGWVSVSVLGVCWWVDHTFVSGRCVLQHVMFVLPVLALLTSELCCCMLQPVRCVCVCVYVSELGIML